MNRYVSKKKKNMGMTMIEVLLGFVLLAAFLGGVSSIIHFSSNMLYNSVDLKNYQEEFIAEMYKKSKPDADEINGKLIFVVTKGAKGAEGKSIVWTDKKLFELEKEYDSTTVLRTYYIEGSE